MASKCDNCRSIWSDQELNEIQNYFERVEAGGTVPSGECPDCGALCYLIRHPKPAKRKSPKHRRT